MGDARYAPCLGGSWHSVETDNAQKRYRWIFGDAWIVLPEELNVQKLLLRLEATPYVPFAGKPRNMVVIRQKDATQGTIFAHDIAEDHPCVISLLPSKQERELCISVPKLPQITVCRGLNSKILSYDTEEVIQPREFVLDPSNDERVIYLRPNKDAIFVEKHTKPDMLPRSLAFKIFRLSVYVIS